ncbi:MAG: hypothetical protein KJO08_00700 [Gammaproteobacteria bacterium]|nr:hypothetical protein [Gammaproteobacteria bacterium]
MRVDTDRFSFDFSNALDAFVFDEIDKNKSTYHGQPMKAVDIVAEFDETYLYVEIKDYGDPGMYDEALADSDDEIGTKRDHFKWLRGYLKYKYRDSYLFRHAEHKVDKPIHYICLLTFDNALNTRMQKELSRELPVGKKSKRWKQAIVESCHVVNIDRWNANFPKWPVSRISASVA